MTIAALASFDLTVRYPWMDASTVWGGDFTAGQYWLGDDVASLGGIASVSRASNAYLADGSGIHSLFTANNLARLDGKGAYVGPSFTSLIADGDDFSQAGWVGASGATKTDLGTMALGIFRRVAIVAGGVTIAGVVTAPMACVSGQPIQITMYYEAGTSGRARINFKSSGTSVLTGVAGALSGVSGSGGSVDNLVQTSLGGGIYRLTCRFTPNATFAGSIGIGPDSSTVGQTVIALGADAIQTSALLPPWVSDASPAPTRAADVVTTPTFDWFTDASLATGATELVAVTFTHTADAVNRPLFEYQTDANNYIRGYINATGHVALKIVTGGVEQTDTALTASVAVGNKAYGFGWDASGGYVTNGSETQTFGAVTLPAVTGKRIGSSIAGNYLNDIIRKIGAGPKLSSAVAASWALAA